MANTDKLRLVGKPGTATTLSAPGHTSGGTSITVGSTTNWPTTTGVTFAIDRITVSGSTETQVAGSYTIWVGDVTGATTIANMTLHPDSPNSDQDYPAGSTTRVYIPVSTATHNDMVQALLDNSMSQDGSLKAGAVDDYDVLGTEAKIYTSAEYAPEGYMQNGQIERTVTSNNITVAIKTIAGTDPSASNPVLVRIGNTVRTITSALSVTKNAGTNWFNSGSTELATYEVDYFTYLGWRASDSSVFIGFARIPHGTTYTDFSATTTNDKYLAYSGTAPASTDEVEVVGRFNATLSATASFNWSVPATSLIINRPIYETRWLTWGETWTSLTVGNATKTSRYKISTNSLDFRIRITAGTTTSASGGAVPVFTLPITVTSTGYVSNMPIGTMLLRGSVVGFGYARWASTTTASIASYFISGTAVADSGLHEAFGNTDILMITADDVEV